MRILPFLLTIFAFAAATAPVQLRADHFEVSLSLTDGQNSQTAKTETEPAPKAREMPVRPTMDSAFGTRCTASWKLTCQSKETLKDVLVHFYVVRLDKAGQAPPPLEPKDVVIETAISM